MKFHHIGIATKSIDDTINYLKKHFNITEISNIVYDPLQDGNLCMLTMEDGHKLELISGNVVQIFLKKRQFLYHICYSTNSIEAELEHFSKDSIVLSLPQKAILFNNKYVVFIMTNIGLIELVEE